MSRATGSSGTSSTWPASRTLAAVAGCFCWLLAAAVCTLWTEAANPCARAQGRALTGKASSGRSHRPARRFLPTRSRLAPAHSAARRRMSRTLAAATVRDTLHAMPSHSPHTDASTATAQGPAAAVTSCPHPLTPCPCDWPATGYTGWIDIRPDGTLGSLQVFAAPSDTTSTCPASMPAPPALSSCPRPCRIVRRRLGLPELDWIIRNRLLQALRVGPRPTPPLPHY